MMCTFKTLLAVTFALILVSWCASVGSLDNTSWDLTILRLAFTKLDSFVRIKCVPRQLNNADCLKKIESTQSMVAMLNYGTGKLAANVILYLSKVQRCNKKAVRLIDATLRARPFAGPEHLEINKLGARFRLDVLVGSILLRAANKCKDYFERWLRRNERRIDSCTRHKLNNLLTREVVRGQKSLDEVLVMRTSNFRQEDPTLEKKLSQMDRGQLVEFYSRYIRKNVVKCCQSYLKRMGQMATVANRLRLAKSTRALGHYFNAPSVELVDSLSRYKICEHATIDQHIYVSGVAKQATDRFVRTRENF